MAQDEITAIAKKRSEFEHIVNGRGTASPSDFARYAEYEMNLESLRKKRAKRMGVKAGGHSGQRRIMFILDRATRKFHGDIALWFQYLSYLRSQKSTGKKMKEVLTSVLRMHPTKPDLWVWGARTALDADADMTSARASCLSNGEMASDHSRRSGPSQFKHLEAFKFELQVYLRADLSASDSRH